MALRRRGTAAGEDRELAAYRDHSDEESEPRTPTTDGSPGKAHSPTAKAKPSGASPPAAAASSWFVWKGSTPDHKKSDDVNDLPPLRVPRLDDGDDKKAAAASANTTAAPASSSWLGAVASGAVSVVGATASVAGAVAVGTVQTAAGVVSGALVAGVPGAIIGGVTSSAAAATSLGIRGAVAVGSGVVSAAGAVVGSMSGSKAATDAKKNDDAVVSPTSAAAPAPAAAPQQQKADAATPACAYCKAAFGMSRWRYNCPNCASDFCASCLTNQQKHRVPRLRLIEPVPLCRTCFFQTCTQCCGGKCFSEWSVSQLKAFMADKGIECQAVEKYDMVRAINNWGSVERE